MQKIQLKSSGREITSANPDKLRKNGQIPAVLYGHNLPNLALTINQSEFEKAFKKAGESTIIDLLTEDGKKHPVLVHDVQKHYLTSAPIHVDFYEVSMTEKLKAKVALEFTGESKAVKELGGVLVKVVTEVEVECLPADLPHNIPISIGNLNTFEDVIHVKDLKIPNGVHILTPLDEVIIKVQPPRDVEAELAVPVDEQAKVEEVIAASTEKKEESAEEGAETAPGKAEAKKEKAKE